MRKIELKAIEQAVESGEAISTEVANWVLRAPGEVLPALFSATSALRFKRFRNEVSLCSIYNAKSGACSEDCAFCAQASCHGADAEITSLAAREDLLSAYEEAARFPIRHFGVVTSGEALTREGIERIARVVKERKVPGVSWCASLGCLTGAELTELKRAGLTRFHHNLETAESFFPEICTTHAYERRIATVRSARAAGLEVCCGGILGLGESLEQRVEFAGILAEEDVQSIPLNFLIPIPGTRLEAQPPMKPLDVLRAVAMFRLTNPRAEIRVCAGRVNLGRLQSMIFHAGANGIMVGRLLTVAGEDVREDLRMLEALELEPRARQS